MLSCPSNGEHCDRHPRFLAGLRVDCGCANDHHQLCVVCIRHLRDQIGSSNKPCPITLCRQLIAHCGGSADIKKKLDELIEKLQADKTMTKMDPAMPLPHELTTEIFRFVDSIDMSSFLQVSRVIHTLANARKNAWNTNSTEFGFFWHGGRDMATNINETHKLTYVGALRPFGCRTYKQQINYFEVKMDRFVENSYVLVGLLARGLQLKDNHYYVGCRGSYSFTTRLANKAGLPVEFSAGDVVGCALITTKSHWNTKRQQIFFTKNGEEIARTFWIPRSEIPLYPFINFRGLGTQVTANFDGNPAKPFLYDLSKNSSSNNGDGHLSQTPPKSKQRKKGRKRTAAD